MDILISGVTQRTGSTLIQRIFNSRKETLIWGEHGGVLTNFYDIYYMTLYFSRASKEERDNYFNNEESPNVWMANMSPEEEFADMGIVASVRSFFENYYQPHRDTHDLIGFKEVRYGEELSLFKTCYPDSSVVLLVRNPIDIWRSMPKGKVWSTFDEFLDLWNRNTKFYLEEAINYSNTHLIRYEDVVQKENNTIELLKEIGKLNDDNINSVLTNKLYSTRKEISSLDEEIIIKSCAENMSKLGYL